MTTPCPCVLSKEEVLDLDRRNRADGAPGFAPGAHFAAGLEALTTKVDKLIGLITPLVAPKITKKRGSELGASEIHALQKTVISSIRHIEAISTSSMEYTDVYALVLKYTEEMVKFMEEGKTDEVRYIHAPTFALMRAVITRLLPENLVPTIQFYDKSTGASEEMISYSTVLRNKDNQDVAVDGETDQVIAHENWPIGNVEVINLGDSCETPNVVAQILAEDKGISGRLRAFLQCEPPRFSSVIVSGRRWRFIDRYFSGGNDGYILFPAVDTINEVVKKRSKAVKLEPHAANISVVSRLLMRMTQSMVILARQSEKKKHDLVNVNLVPSMDDDEGDDGEGDLDSHDSDYDSEGGPVKGPSQELSKKRATSGQGGPSGKRSKDIGGRGSGNTSSLYLTVTKENKRRHDVDTFWIQRPDLS
eukprot:gene30959-37418_t